MLQFLALLRAFREYLVLTLLTAVSLALIARSDSAQIQALRSLSLIVFASVQSSTDWIPSIFSTSYENESLREVNMNLMEEVIHLRRLRQENTELRNLLGFKSRSRFPLIPAEVVGRNHIPGQSMLTINMGENDSVRVQMPVINEKGLVGKVIATSNNYSIVQLALSRDFRVTAKINRSRVDGIIAWKEGDALLLQNIWKIADVRIGDTIVTSEYSNIYPPEIPIGVISRIGPGEGGLFRKIEVVPQASFEKLERVFVVKYIGNEEKKSLETTTFPSETRQR